MSDGCSIPETLRAIVTVSPAQRRACVQHDRAYYFGGSASDRLRADLRWAVELSLAGMAPAVVEWWLAIVRVHGSPVFRQPYSWAFGGQVFRYTASPAVDAGVESQPCGSS